MSEIPTYHEVAGSEYWTDLRIEMRLGEIALQLPEVDQPSGEYYALQKEIDALSFELTMRERES